MDEEYIKKLIVARLNTMPPNVGFSLGSFGSFSRDEIIDNVQRGTEVGQEFTKIELKMILESPKLVGRLSGKKASSY